MVIIFIHIHITPFIFIERKIHFYWSIIDVQYYVNFWYTANWFSYVYVHIHIYVFFFIFYSIIGCYKILSVIPCATTDLAVYLFYILKIFISANSKLLIYPLLLSPLVNVSLFSRFMSLFLFCKQVHLYHLFRFQMQVISYGICQKTYFL